jgi:hypothetical protein
MTYVSDISGVVNGGAVAGIVIGSLVLLAVVGALCRARALRRAAMRAGTTTVYTPLPVAASYQSASAPTDWKGGSYAAQPSTFAALPAYQAQQPYQGGVQPSYQSQPPVYQSAGQPVYGVAPLTQASDGVSRQSQPLWAPAPSAPL